MDSRITYKISVLNLDGERKRVYTLSINDPAGSVTKAFNNKKSITFIGDFIIEDLTEGLIDRYNYRISNKIEKECLRFNFPSNKEFKVYLAELALKFDENNLNSTEVIYNDAPYYHKKLMEIIESPQ